jgi:hypothetical protein
MKTLSGKAATSAAILASLVLSTAPAVADDIELEPLPLCGSIRVQYIGSNEIRFQKYEYTSDLPSGAYGTWSANIDGNAAVRGNNYSYYSSFTTHRAGSSGSSVVWWVTNANGQRVCFSSKTV